MPLSDDGEIQAKRIADHLRATRLDAVYSSPLSRSVATASAVTETRDLTPELRAGLAEIDFGAFEGRTFDDISATDPELYTQWMREPARMRFPGGESFDDLRGRVSSEIARIRRDHRGGSVAVVTHAGPIRAVLADVLGLDGGPVFRIGQSWGGMSSIEWVGEEPIIRFVNVTI